MKQQQTELIERLRVLLADEPSIREVSMFGGRSFMVNDKMIVSALRDGDLLVRAAPERDGELVDLTGATSAEMGVGRAMGPGWVAVAVESIVDERQLSFWLGVALEYNRTKAGTRS